MSTHTIDVGPLLGHTTDSSSKIWMRGCAGKHHDEGEYCYGAVDLYRDGHYQKSMACHLKDYYDFTGILPIQGLQADTAYEARCGLRYFRDAAAPAVQVDLPTPMLQGAPDHVIEFRTDRGTTDGKLRFVFGSCRYLYWDNVLHSDGPKGDKTFRSIVQQHQDNPLDLVLMIGDQIYADPLNALHRYESAKDLFEVYRKSFRMPHIRTLMSRVPTYMIMDDHEIRDNWSKTDMREANQGFFANAMRAYASYQHLHNPDTPSGQYWYTFKRSSFPFFVMDTRTQRLKDDNASEPKTMLGREQLNALLDWLHEHRKAPMKFLVSSVPFFPDPKAYEDKWAGFAAERSMLLEFIRVEQIRNVVFLSGDVHNTHFAQMRCYQDSSFKLTSLVSSPFYWPYPHEAASAFYGGRTLEFMEWTDRKRRARDRIEYRYEGEAFIGDESFVVVDIDLSRSAKMGQAIVRSRKNEKFSSYDKTFEF